MPTPHLALINLDDLRQLLAELAPANDRPALLDRGGLARALSCSPGHVDQLRKQGLPCVQIGEASPRFELGECVEWLKSRGAR